jgi:hypothetical protein
VRFTLGGRTAFHRLDLHRTCRLIRIGIPLRTIVVLVAEALGSGGGRHVIVRTRRIRRSIATRQVRFRDIPTVVVRLTAFFEAAAAAATTAATASAPLT